ncbi:sodium channel protein Nach-like [Frankliniella occidentalis]|uniref:Sodium channel protein Nach-like n=1 Tax=Frankliniella occidentalis TaxID=133901 RepID=A0A9C6XCK6_FRAOC|nr:sodium channel protein Nach-like [Frankliniella occidentalis]
MAALVIVDSLWDKFQTSPTITGLDTDFHNWDVPFPAVTLCLQDPANETLLEAYLKEKWPDADEAKKEYYTGFLKAVTNTSFESFHNLLPYLNDTSLPQNNLRELSYQLVSGCSAFTDCAYKQTIEDDRRDCCSLLWPVYTEHGFCHAFNLNYTALDYPGVKERPKPFIENLIEETDARWSFSFDTEDPINNTVAVFITAANALPGADVNPQHIWNKRVSKLMFVPKMTYTVDDAKQLSIAQRGCVFWDEIKLKIDPIYTHSSCMRQCRMDAILRLCGCLPFFYTLLPKQRHCSLPELKCVIDHLAELHTFNLTCPCQLGCEHTVYDMEKPHEAGGDEGNGEAAGVEVGFLSWPLTRFKREVLFGQVDLLVAIGTIAGLFLGFSLLSGLEIIYLFTLRAWCMLHTDREYLEDLANEYERKEKEPVDLSLRPAFIKGGQDAVGQVDVEAAPRLQDLPPPLGPPMWKSTVATARMNQKGMYAYPYGPYGN